MCSSFCKLLFTLILRFVSLLSVRLAASTFLREANSPLMALLLWIFFRFFSSDIVYSVNFTATARPSPAFHEVHSRQFTARTAFDYNAVTRFNGKGCLALQQGLPPLSWQLLTRTAVSFSSFKSGCSSNAHFPAHRKRAPKRQLILARYRACTKGRPGRVRLLRIVVDRYLAGCEVHSRGVFSEQYSLSTLRAPPDDHAAVSK